MHRHLRSVLLAIGALMFVSSAWAVIFTAMTAAHSAGSSYSYDGPVTGLSGGSPGCGFSMEIFPVAYVDERGHKTTAWERKFETATAETRGYRACRISVDLQDSPTI
jgi:hypothetical protein